MCAFASYFENNQACPVVNVPCGQSMQPICLFVPKGFTFLKDKSNVLYTALSDEKKERKKKKKHKSEGSLSRLKMHSAAKIGKNVMVGI